MVPLGVHCLAYQIPHPSLIATPCPTQSLQHISNWHRKYLMGVTQREDQRKKEKGECSPSMLPGDGKPFFPSPPVCFLETGGLSFRLLPTLPILRSILSLSISSLLLLATEPLPLLLPLSGTVATLFFWREGGVKLVSF